MGRNEEIAMVTDRHLNTSRRKFLAQTVGAGVALVAGPRFARAAAEKITFQLDWIAYGRHAPFYVALEKGFYGKRDLDVTIQQGTGTLQGLRTLVAGQAQFIFNDIGSMMVLRARDNVKIKALACIFQKAPHTLFYLKSSGIAKPKDFEGKKIAFSPGDSPRLIFPAFAQANGIDESKVSWLSVDPNSKNAMLLNRNTEGMVTYIFTIPILQKAAPAGEEVGAFVYSDWGVDFYSNGLLVMEDYLAKNPAVAKRFVQATMEGVEYTLANAQEAVTIMKKYQPQMDEGAAVKEVAILRDLIAADATKKVRLGSMTREKMQQTADLMAKYLDLKGSFGVEEAFTNDYLS
jgi:NitT/TauT family transport system substrate-binding protein